MTQYTHKAFSKLHEKAILEKRLVVSLSKRLRNRIWQILIQYNDGLGIQRDPNDRWIDESDIATEILPKLYRLYGESQLEGRDESGRKVKVNLEGFISSTYPNRVFDVIQLWYDELTPDRQPSFQRELNGILEEEACPWCFCDRNFFQVDSKFLEERVQSQVHEILNAQGFFGAMQEFVEARNDFTSGDFKGTILNSCKAFESVMKIILGKEGGTADDLIKGLDKIGIFDELPKELRRPFETKVFQTVPFLRNTLAGHGQGQHLVKVSRELGELSLHLAGAIILFCIRKHLTLNPQQLLEPNVTNTQEFDEDIPF
jgi:hypothetical protein